MSRKKVKWTRTLGVVVGVSLGWASNGKQCVWITFRFVHRSGEERFVKATLWVSDRTRDLKITAYKLRALGYPHNAPIEWLDRQHLCHISLLGRQAWLEWGRNSENRWYVARIYPVTKDIEKMYSDADRMTRMLERARTKAAIANQSMEGLPDEELGF